MRRWVRYSVLGFFALVALPIVLMLCVLAVGLVGLLACELGLDIGCTVSLYAGALMFAIPFIIGCWMGSGCIE